MTTLNQSPYAVIEKRMFRDCDPIEFSRPDGSRAAYASRLARVRYETIQLNQIDSK